MGEAVASRTILRKGEDWEHVADRVAAGNAGLDKGSPQDYANLQGHIANGHILMSGRHLQHGDKSQYDKEQTVFTNCSTSAASFIKFYLLLNGSGVGRVYDDDMMLVDWRQAPKAVCVLSKDHPDWTEEWMTPDQSLSRGYAGVTFHTVEDSREGWAHALELWEYSAFLSILKEHTLVFDFSKVRPKGSPIAGMQDRPASGPVPTMLAFMAINNIRQQDMEPWKQAMWVDHHLADCVLMGGVRRSARIAGKWWKDKDIHEFIDIKRPDELLGLHTISEIKAARAANPNMWGKLWTANNSVIVDDEFWDLVKRRDQSPLGRQALEVFEHVCRNAYADGTGEPGFVTVSSLSCNEEGLGDMPDDWFGSPKFKPRCPPGYLKALTQRFKRKKHKFFVNPLTLGASVSNGGMKTV